jgi:hypothetical protein
MKIARLLVPLALITSFQIANAEEETADATSDVSVYCEEQAQLAGIEDSNESVQYIQECIDSFAIQSDDMQ